MSRARTASPSRKSATKSSSTKSRQKTSKETKPNGNGTPARQKERQLFGTDGVRGMANVYPMTPEMALQLGRAVTFVAGRGKRHAPIVLIGKDTRLSGYMLESALASGICAMGGRVMLCGPIPTPAIAHLTMSMRADAGIVISASHNPYSDNGIKIFGSDGYKLPDEAEIEIEHLMRHDGELGLRPTGPGIGRTRMLEDARGRYIVFAKNTFPSDISLNGLSLIVDAAHGAAYKTAPAIFAELGADVHAIGVEPNGLNINDDAGALAPNNLRAEVVNRRADIGIALDGDADRLVVVDEKGQIVDGDAVMAMCATRMMREGILKKNTVVATVMSNLGLEHAMHDLGGSLVRTNVGDRYVVEAMRKHGYNLGGEQSGHLVFLDHSTTGDGTIAALQVLALMVRTGQPLSELAHASMMRVPQVLKNVSLPAKYPLDSMRELSKAKESIERELGDEGRVLIRWSGTEPKLRIMLEGPHEDDLHQWAGELATCAQRDARSMSVPPPAG